jgi:MinD-like ATPase involved in chromosome partitioning or flagellar assembly
MALANVAWILASNGLRVLTIDWDLEAPGLHRYFHPFLIDKQLSTSPGVIDWVVDFASAALTRVDQKEQPQTDKETGKDLSLDNWFYPRANLLRYAVSLRFDFPKPGTLDFVPAGRQDLGYAIRVNSFNWKNLYDKLGGGVFLEAAKDIVRNEYDYVLIDSRTGVSDTSGICTIQMPEELVVCFTLNSQSIGGAAAAARSALEQRKTPKGESSIKIWPIPMRIETSEKDRLEKARAAFRTKFNLQLDHLLPPQKEEYWGRVEVPYLPYYAFEEVLATIADPPRQSHSLLSSMETLTSYISNGSVTSLKILDEQPRRNALAQFSSRPASEYADEFLSLAAEYERVRQQMQPGNERTYHMTAVVDRARTLLGASAPGNLPDLLFDLSRPGTRVIALALAQQAGDVSFVRLAISATAEPKSPFEQYHALVLGEGLLPLLGDDAKRKFADAIVSQTGNFITQQDPSRWNLSRSILKQIMDPSSSSAAAAAPTPDPQQKQTDSSDLNMLARRLDAIKGPQTDPSDSQLHNPVVAWLLPYKNLLVPAALGFLFAWAVLFYYRDHPGKPQNRQASNQSNTEAAPIVPPKQASVRPYDWGVLISSDKQLFASGPGGPSAAYEIELASDNDLQAIGLYQRRSWYATVVQFEDQQSARLALQSLQTMLHGRWKTATVVRIGTWCANADASSSVEINNTQVPLFRCGK